MSRFVLNRPEPVDGALAEDVASTIKGVFARLRAGAAAQGGHSAESCVINAAALIMAEALSLAGEEFAGDAEVAHFVTQGAICSVIADLFSSYSLSAGDLAFNIASFVRPVIDLTPIKRAHLIATGQIDVTGEPRGHA